MSIEGLLAVMDGDDLNEAEEAMWSLKAHGADALEPLLEAAPRMGRFGQLSAIELLEEIGDTRAGEVLVPMLQSEHDTVRDWAAGAIGRLRVEPAVPQLKRAYAETRRRGTPPDWTEPVSIRHALTALGARREVTPDRVRELRQANAEFGACWRPSDLPELIEELARARQLVLYSMWWQPYGESWSWLQSPSWELDWSLPLDALVEAARAAALDALSRAAAPPAGTVATLEWIDEADLRVSF